MTEEFPILYDGALEMVFRSGETEPSTLNFRPDLVPSEKYVQLLNGVEEVQVMGRNYRKCFDGLDTERLESRFMPIRRVVYKIDETDKEHIARIIEKEMKKIREE